METASGALRNFRSHEVRRVRDRRYSICSIKEGGERRARGISELGGEESTPWTHKSFIYKQGLISRLLQLNFGPDAGAKRELSNGAPGFVTGPNQRTLLQLG